MSDELLLLSVLHRSQMLICITRVVLCFPSRRARSRPTTYLSIAKDIPLFRRSNMFLLLDRTDGSRNDFNGAGMVQPMSVLSIGPSPDPNFSQLPGAVCILSRSDMLKLTCRGHSGLTKQGLKKIKAKMGKHKKDGGLLRKARTPTYGSPKSRVH